MEQSKIYSIQNSFSLESHLNRLNIRLKTKNSPENLFKAKRRMVMNYRIVFMGLGFLFLFLSALLIYKTPNWHFTLVFGYGLTAKTLLAAFTASLGITASWLALALRSEVEAAKSIAASSKSIIEKLYERQKLERGYAGIMGFTADQQTKSLHIANFRLVNEKMDELLNSALQLIDEIALCSSTGGKAKNQLHSQTLSDLKTGMDKLIKEYQNHS